MSSELYFIIVIGLVLILIVLSKRENIVGQYTGGGNQRPSVTLHYADWCRFCTMFKPAFEEVRGEATNSNVEFILNDEVKYPTPNLKGYPTTYLYKNGNKYEYQMPQESDKYRLKAHFKAWLRSHGLVVI